jgi:DNA ligase (NAD+)
MTGILEGKTVCFTGTLSLPREEASIIVEQHGGTVVGSVSRNVDYLIVGEKVGRIKINKVQELGIEVLNEQQLFDLIDGDSQNDSTD